MEEQLLQSFCNDQDWLIAIIGAIIGSVLTLVATVGWDNYKNKKRYKALLRLLLSELRENQKRAHSAVENLPQDIRYRTAKENMGIDKGVYIPA